MPAAAQQVSASSIHVAVQEGLLTVEVRDVPLADVLRLIGERAGLKMTIRGDLSTRVTRSFRDLPLDEGIRRLVGGHSVALVYAPARGAAGARLLTEVWVIEGSPPDQARIGVDPTERSARLEAVQALGRRRDEAAAAALAQILIQDADPSIRRRAAAALGHFGGGQAAAALTTALRDQEPSVRIQVVRTLRRVEGDRATDALAGVLMRDPDPRVRREAARALPALGSEQARRALEAAASDPDESVRREVTSALRRWGTLPR